MTQVVVEHAGIEQAGPQLDPGSRHGPKAEPGVRGDVLDDSRAGVAQSSGGVSVEALLPVPARAGQPTRAEPRRVAVSALPPAPPGQGARTGADPHSRPAQTDMSVDAEEESGGGGVSDFPVGGDSDDSDAGAVGVGGDRRVGLQQVVVRLERLKEPVSSQV